MVWSSLVWSSLFLFGLLWPGPFWSSCLVTSTSAVRVDDSVPFQMVHQDEGFPALRAAVRPLSAVRALVNPEAALLREPFPALSAAVRLLARVRPVVDAEVGGALEALPTHRAPEGTLPLVTLLVQLELVQAAEGLPAHHAHVSPRRSGQRPVVAVETAAGRQRVVRLSSGRSFCGSGLALAEFVRLP